MYLPGGGDSYSLHSPGWRRFIHSVFGWLGEIHWLLRRQTSSAASTYFRFLVPEPGNGPFTFWVLRDSGFSRTSWSCRTDRGLWTRGKLGVAVGPGRLCSILSALVQSSCKRQYNWEVKGLPRPSAETSNVAVTVALQLFLC